MKNILNHELAEPQNTNTKELQISEPTIALLHCYDLIDDFLDSINISFETFCQEFVGSWMFGYINALKEAGVRTVLFCISARVERPSRFTHIPTNTQICVLPPSQTYRPYRALRRKSLNVYGASTAQSFKEIQDNNPIRRSLLTPVKDLAKSVGTYLCTPLGLLAEELKRENCQAILCQEYEYARFDSCTLLGKMTGIPVFATFQGGDRTQSWLEVPWRHLSFRNCAGVIVATQTEIQRIQSAYGIGASKIGQIFNPVDIATWQGSDRLQARKELDIPLDARVVVWHGRVEIERKGLDILLEAWQQICNQRPDINLRLLIVGTGSDAAQLQQRIASMQLKGVLWLNEFVSDRSIMQRYLSAADVYTLPSRQEGFPVAPLEAMACSLPVVAADAPGVPDIFAGGDISGGLVVPRENATALAQALAQVLDNEAWGRELGKRARQRVESYFAPQIVGKQLRDFILGQNSHHAHQ
ncbi:Glycosyl transferase, group 1 [Trichormus variabilis ATCC 29413]|uniref:Glycosyl transferase, group 1 n=2 Tax=Anabaena variabilis TaxID=264691 RepID=Q3MEW5_TRIV2|nr:MULTISPECIES: glycosyltransferase family 4 protein [Nostocaceae]ABA20471.1 Glycosyl transferase, group 1 [Trichormus variabilis ATCC 29413]MBC1215804.1 glycosyltransferase family 4 protein [Trichormus variabilis ARAD]MBC1257923.1 glycosyltransferase family 4 protein [Trichormus variabilis V5]MBC1267982.1 glycosyltransferase family 4 protein [Trichormus variabilis FSR]MBC1304378.1 glycosyltransferase family 4 protein [Trichormus variabilis N2B]